MSSLYNLCATSHSAPMDPLCVNTILHKASMEILLQMSFKFSSKCAAGVPSVRQEEHSFDESLGCAQIHSRLLKEAPRSSTHDHQRFGGLSIKTQFDGVEATTQIEYYPGMIGHNTIRLAPDDVHTFRWRSIITRLFHLTGEWIKLASSLGTPTD